MTVATIAAPTGSITLADRALEKRFGFVWMLRRRTLVRTNLRGYAFELTFDTDDVRLLIELLRMSDDRRG